MKRYFAVSTIALAALACLLTGCEPPYAGPYAPDISGEWTGQYYLREIGRTTRHLQESLTATVYQNETNHTKVTVLTSKAGAGHSLRGSVDAQGKMYLFDDYDNEIWTTHYRFATTNQIELNDIIYEEEPVARDWGDLMATIKLTHRVPERQEGPFDWIFGAVDNPDRVLLR
ncbi:MAG: hypothetical protein HQ559_06345 [Lentisphaerae bacterium]|nr:hypothetical protein [Lentisphaerota bacterium]